MFTVLSYVTEFIVDRFHCVTMVPKKAPSYKAMMSSREICYFWAVIVGVIACAVAFFFIYKFGAVKIHNFIYLI